MKDYGYKTRKVLKKNERLSKDEAWNFWKTAKDKDDDRSKNAPKNYIQGIERSIYLADLITKYLHKESKILEIGCNVGRNLNCLHKKSFKNLSGVEINRDAIELMSKTYPSLHKTAKIYVSSIEDWITNISECNFDLIYTVAVLEHIHWDSEFIFNIMKKISAKYIITIEDEFTPWSN